MRPKLIKTKHKNFVLLLGRGNEGKNQKEPEKLRPAWEIMVLLHKRITKWVSQKENVSVWEYQNKKYIFWTT